MGKIRNIVAALCAFMPALAFAGEPNGRLVPTLGEAGLVVLGVALLGGGIAALRRRRR